MEIFQKKSKNDFAFFNLKKQMKIAVFGTPQLSADIFETLSQTQNIEVVAAVTAPDRPAGRGKKLAPPPVKIWAEKKGIPFFQPEKPDESLAKELKKKDVELLIVIAYGYIFTKNFLASAPTAWNLHLSLLPKYRGTSPVPAAILAGEKTSGVTVFHIQPGMDDGPVLGQKEFDIQDNRADVVYEKIEKFGSHLLCNLLTKRTEGVSTPEIQQDEIKATFCHKVSKQDGFLNPQTESAESALQKMRAYFPWPGTSVEHKGKRLKILDAKLSDTKLLPNEFSFNKTGVFLGFSPGTLELTEVQPEGKRPMTGMEFGCGQNI